MYVYIYIYWEFHGLPTDFHIFSEVGIPPTRQL